MNISTNINTMQLDEHTTAICNSLLNNPDEIVKAAARKRMINFSRWIMPDLELEPFHVVYYTLLDMFAHGQIKKMIVQEPPQHGKSQGSSRFLPSFILGLDPNKKCLIGSYSATIARDFNKDNQRIIDSYEYRQLFPNTFLNNSNGTTRSNMYARNIDVFECVGKKGGLRAVGRGGSLTSKTIDISILDDVYKDYKEGNSPVVRDAAWKWYTTVVRSRLDNNAQELIVFTRWHSDDLIGRLEKSGEQIIDIKCWDDLKDIPRGAWVRINFEAIKTGEPTEIDPREPGVALWPNRHDIVNLDAKRKLDPVQFQCLYQGNPGSAEGRLYKYPFKTWTPDNKHEYGKYIRSGAYTDVADEGDDYLFTATYDIYLSDNKFFNEKTQRFEPILFALITSMEMTEENTDVTVITSPRLVNENGVQLWYIESNNGGRGYSNNVSKKVKSIVIPFFQSNNKETRIKTNAAFVNSCIVMPYGWHTTYKKIYDHVTEFLSDFHANAKDDAEDALTGIYEKEIEPGNINPYSNVNRGVRVR